MDTAIFSRVLYQLSYLGGVGMILLVNLSPVKKNPEWYTRDYPLNCKIRFYLDSVLREYQHIPD